MCIRDRAALGGDVKISTVDGDVRYTVKPGTQTDTKIRLKGKGVPSLRNSNVRGDHYVTCLLYTSDRDVADSFFVAGIDVAVAFEQGRNLFDGEILIDPHIFNSLVFHTFDVYKRQVLYGAA